MWEVWVTPEGEGKEEDEEEEEAAAAIRGRAPHQLLAMGMTDLEIKFWLNSAFTIEDGPNMHVRHVSCGSRRTVSHIERPRTHERYKGDGPEDKDL